MKQWRSLDDQLTILKDRGMVITDDARAKAALERFGYYRLSGYWFPFRTKDADGNLTSDFVPGTHLSEIIDLYVFDKRLRLLCLDALERIELALQVDVAYALGKRDPSAHLQDALMNQKFVKNGQYAKWLARYRDLEHRSRKAAFVKHNKQQYGELPIWVAVQILDFGALSHLFQMLPINIQQKIAGKYGVSSGKYLIQWMRAFSQIRNASAHHERLWNNHIKDHADVPAQLVEISWTDQYELFRYICLMQFFMRQMCPNSSWRKRISEHIANFPTPKNNAITSDAMGLTTGWQDWKLWKGED